MAPSEKASPPGPGLAADRIVVTGATGFLGGHVLKQLRGTGAHVVAVVDRNRASRHPNPLQFVETLTFDHAGHLVAAVRAARPDRVIHLHAAVTTERDAAAIARTLEANLLPSLDLMTACAEMGVKRLILMGSGEEFGPVTGPFDEYTIADPPSPYGASKAAVSGYAKMFSNAFDLPVVLLRPSVVYGPFQAPRMLVPQVMHALHQRREIAVTEGRQTRDFIYVEDVARGILAALTAEGIAGRSYNLASGEVVTVRDCLARIERISGRSGLIRYGAIPYEPVAQRSYDALRWRPQVSLDAGLAATWACLTNLQALSPVLGHPSYS
jgi:nucleoside-diphosphate-sugar epimerase